MAVLFAFTGDAGRQTGGPAHWPEGTALEHSHVSPTILVFAHPFCSCTRATLEELDTVIGSRRFPNQPLVEVLFARVDPGWKPGDSWRRALRIANATATWDEEGNEARIFGAGTSGFVLLYDARGLLLFEGGITGLRGHAGDNYGAERLAAALDSGRPSPGSPSRVFGCALFDSRGSGI
jgi:hypothetical protein